MPAPSGGSVVDQSLLRQAADRGVTICFADLDGADGLWVPEERTVLVNRGLSEAKAAEVIEHELAHVRIDDQHADLDAGKDVLVGHPPSRSWSWRPETVALAAAVALLAVVGGVLYGVNAARGDDKLNVAPNNGPGLTASESAGPRNLPPNVFRTRGPDGRIVYVTVTPTPAKPTPTASATAKPTASATATKPPARAPGTTTVPVRTPTTSAPPAAPPTTDPPQTTPTPEVPPTPAPTSAAAPSAGVGNTGDQGGGGASDPAPGPTQPATVANAPITEASSDLAPVDSTMENPLDNTPGTTSR